MKNTGKLPFLRIVMILYAVLLLAGICGAAAYAERDDYGNCGASAYWDMDKDGLLTISGRGAIDVVKYNQALWYKHLVKNVVIESGITGIGKNSFADCVNLESVVVPDTVTKIDSKAFSGCKALKSISLLDSITTLAQDAFDGCNAYKYANIGSEGAKVLCKYGWFFSVPGLECRLMYEYANMNIGYTDWTESRIPSWNGGVFFGEIQGLDLSAVGENIQSVHIPEGVTSVGYFGTGFQGKKQLTEVTFPESLRGLPSFAGCSALRTISLPVNTVQIGSNTFKGCSSLEEITFPNTLEGIGTSAFEGCTALTELQFPASLTGIGASAFRDCTTLTELQFPASLTEIGEQAFQDCTGLNRIVFPGTKVTVKTWAFAQCAALAGIEGLPEDAVLYDDSFIGCTALPTIMGKWVLESREKDGTFLPWYYLAQHKMSATVEFVDLDRVVVAEILRGKRTQGEFYRYLDGVYLGNYRMRPTFDSARVTWEDELDDRYQLVNGKLIRTDKNGRIDVFVREVKLHSLDRTMILPAGLKTIRDEAFLNCPEIECFIVPDTVKEIGTDPFPEGAVIICTWDSFAAEWAAENGYTVEYEGKTQYGL